MTHSIPLPFSFLVMMLILLCGCAPVCSSKRQPARGKIVIRPVTRPKSPQSLPVQPGDILFIAIPNPLFRHVSNATRCPATHVGIVLHDPVQGWVVAESAVPLSKITPLDQFVARSDAGWCAIRRPKIHLTAENLRALRSECDSRMGILYHPGFRYESSRLFCSKFVYDVNLNALGMRIGKVETFSELFARNPDAGLTFWRCWFLGRIPWKRLTVTPASQYESDLLKTVWVSTTPGK